MLPGSVDLMKWEVDSGKRVECSECMKVSNSRNVHDKVGESDLNTCLCRRCSVTMTTKRAVQESLIQPVRASQASKVKKRLGEN